IPCQFTQHIPWKLRTRRQKLMIVAFYVIILALVTNVTFLVVFLCVYRHHDTFGCPRSSQSPDTSTNTSGMKVTNDLLT
ncbi:hypothetical protein KR018_008401, partial [Drosophila ironensis]